jgi:hypothetical protein
MTYTGAPCGAHVSEFDVDRSSDGNGGSRSVYTPKVVRRWVKASVNNALLGSLPNTEFAPGVLLDKLPEGH